MAQHLYRKCGIYLLGYTDPGLGLVLVVPCVPGFCGRGLDRGIGSCHTHLCSCLHNMDSARQASGPSECSWPNCLPAHSFRHLLASGSAQWSSWVGKLSSWAFLCPEEAEEERRGGGQRSCPHLAHCQATEVGQSAHSNHPPHQALHTLASARSSHP